MAERPFSTASGDIKAIALAIAEETPLPSNSDTGSSFLEPRAPYMAAAQPTTSDSPRESSWVATPNDSGTMLATKNENYVEDPVHTTPPPTSKRRTVILVLLFLVALILIAAAVVVPVYFTVIRPKSNRTTKNSSGGGSSPTTSGGPSGGSAPPNSPTTGGDGSTVYTANGTFTYSNKFGGFCKYFTDFILSWRYVNPCDYWAIFKISSLRPSTCCPVLTTCYPGVDDPNDPFNNNAQPNSWTPPLNKSWDYTVTHINGCGLISSFLSLLLIFTHFFLVLTLEAGLFWNRSLLQPCFRSTLVPLMSGP